MSDIKGGCLPWRNRKIILLIVSTPANPNALDIITPNNVISKWHIIQITPFLMVQHSEFYCTCYTFQSLQEVTWFTKYINEGTIFLHGSLTFCCFCKHFDLTCFTSYCDYLATMFVNSTTFQETIFMAKCYPCQGTCVVIQSFLEK